MSYASGHDQFSARIVRIYEVSCRPKETLNKTTKQKNHNHMRGVVACLRRWSEWIDSMEWRREYVRKREMRSFIGG